MGAKKLTPEKIAHLAKLKRAKRIRAKVAKGTATEAERQELATIPPAVRGRPRKVKVDDQGDINGEPTVDVTAPIEHTDDAMPPPPPPPRVEVLPAKGADWRSGYRQTVGREAACAQVAALYCGVLKRLAQFIEDSGSSPIMTAEAIDKVVYPAAVLTADRFLPDIEVGPEVELAIGSGLVLGQAAIVASRNKRMKGAKKPPQGEPMPVPPGVAERPADEPARPTNGAGRINPEDDAPIPGDKRDRRVW